MTSFSLQTLGFPEIRRDGEPCPLTLRKGLALLVYLAEAKGPIGREVLATLLWPEDPEDLVRSRLRRLLHRLQQALGDDALVADRATVRWSPAITLHVDSQAFERASERGDFEEACRLYAGDFLEGFSPGDCPQFNEWAFFRREALRGRAIQALERAVHARNVVGDFTAAVARAESLVAFDPLSEVYVRHLIRNLLLAGDRATAERHFEALTRRLRDELQVSPEPETRALLDADSSLVSDDLPPTRYASGGGVHIAYQVCGAGRLDVLVSGGFLSHVERLWDEPHCRAFLSALSKTGRLILFDRRGIGLSDRIGFTPNVDSTAQDIRTVLDAAGSRRVVLMGASEGGPACIKVAADQRDRVAGLILIGSLAKGSAAADYPCALRADQYDAWLQQLIGAWGGPAGIETFAPSLAANPQTRAWWAGLLRAASSPGALKAVLEALRDTDVRHLLGRISVPCLVLHRRADRAVRIEAGRHLARHIPQARLVELEGADHWLFAGDQALVLSNVRQFIGSLGSEVP